MNRPLSGPEVHYQFGSYFSPVACELISWSLNMRHVAERIEKRFRIEHGISLEYLTVWRRGTRGCRKIGVDARVLSVPKKPRK